MLVVDDDPDLRAAYEDVLAAHGYAVATAANGYEALAYLRSHRAPHLILLDVLMPVMDGAALRHELMRDRCLRTIPVLVVTGERAVDLTMPPWPADCLRKPISVKDLVGAVSRLLPAGRLEAAPR